MDYTDFNTVGNKYVDLYSLSVGDYFMEDTYPEVYVVRKIVMEDETYGKLQKIVKTENITNGGNQNWFYDREIGSAFAPCLVKLSPKFT